jgi:type IV pilus assembly protein PilA
MQMRRIETGFSLIELLVVIIIIAIISSIAIPSYSSYMKRARYSEIIQAAAPYKLSVIECYSENQDLSNCNSGNQYIPGSVTSGIIKSIIVSDGVITITPIDIHGITSADTYILTPKISDGQLSWSKSGGAVNKGLVA